MSFDLKRFFALALLAAFLRPASALALIVYGSGTSDVNNSLNVLATNALPPNGAPAANVVQFGVNNASGVYLGHGYVLTACHVNMVDTGIVINGVSYNRDLTFDPLQVTEDNPATSYADVVDLKLVKILGNPGLPALPVVQNLPLNYSLTDDLNAATTITGWGLGKGPFITAADGVTNANKGWLWGDDSTRALRWATNTTFGSPDTATYDISFNGNTVHCHYEVLETSFKRLLGSTTGQIALGDSGGGVFQQFSGVWKLAAINTTILSFQSSAATYDHLAPFSPNPQPTDTPDFAEPVRISRYGYLMRYENWANLKLGDPAASLTADPDGDGVPNLLEYAFHTEPTTAASAAYPQVGMESGYVTLTYTQLLSATDLTYTVQASTDLTNPSGWSAPTVIEEVVSTSGVTRVVKDKVAIGTASQMFLRLSVTHLQ